MEHLKLDATKDPTGCEHISIAQRCVIVCKRLLKMTTSKQCDALTLTELVITELTNAGLSLDKILRKTRLCLENCGKHNNNYNKYIKQ